MPASDDPVSAAAPGQERGCPTTGLQLRPQKGRARDGEGKGGGPAGTVRKGPLLWEKPLGWHPLAALDFRPSSGLHVRLAPWSLPADLSPGSHHNRLGYCKAA